MEKKGSISYWNSYWEKGKTKKRNRIDPRGDFEAQIRIRKNVKILDAGCGKGYRALYFRKCDFLVGIDQSKEAIEYANREFGRTYYNVQFIIGDLEHLPFKKGVFDFILFSEVLEHIFEQKREIVLQGLLDTASSKGQLFLTTPNGMYFPLFLRRILHFLSRGRLSSSYSLHIYDHPIFPSSLMKLLKNTGWQVIMYKRETYLIPYTEYSSPKIPLFAVLQFVIAVPS